LVATVGVAAAGVVAGRPAEDVAAAGRLVGPGRGALEGLAFEGGVERLGEGVVSARAHGPQGQGDPEPGAERRVVLGGVLGAVIGVKIAPPRLPRVEAASVRASATRSVRRWSAIAQPARRREQQSITVARYRFVPSAIGR
jgi:hypothetical protein